MPTYEYACIACDDRFDVVQRFADAPLTECRACGGRLRKVFSPVGVVFKGSGFYQTDSRSNGTAKGESKDPKPADAKPAEPKPADRKPAEGPSSSTAPAAAAS